MLKVVSEVAGNEVSLSFYHKLEQCTTFLSKRWVSFQLGSYFGSSVCVVDLNADGLSDLLVGAPMATGTSREEGRVHVYINEGEVGTFIHSSK